MGRSSRIRALGTATDDERAVLEATCREYSETRDPELRAYIIERHDWLVRVCARQLTRRGESFDDLVQTGMIGLVKAVDRFDPAFGVQFRTFASATISGELRRHYRGTWRVKVARPLQERHLAVTGAIDVLTARLNRSPTAADIAAYLEIDLDEVIEAIAVGSTFSPAPLDDVDAGHTPLAATDADILRCEERADLRALLARLDDRQRDVVYLRFYCDKTQSEIAEELGLSQVHVSRLLRAALDRLRAAAAESRD